MNGRFTAALMVTLLAFGGADAQQYSMAEGAAVGRITVSGGSTVRSWSCDVTQFNASVRSTVAGVLPTGREQASFTIPVRAIDCRNRTMNGHLREALEGDEHPEIRLDVTSYTIVDAATLRANVRLEVGGQVTPITVDASYVQGEGVLRVHGEKRLRMTQLGVEPPTLMLGTLRVHDDVRIGFDLVIQQSAVTLAALQSAGGR